MANDENWIKPTAEQWDELRRFSLPPAGCDRPGAWYKTGTREELPNIFPPSLVAKCCGFVAMGSDVVPPSGSFDLSTSSTVVVLNLLRGDQKASAIDQEPFGFMVVGQEPSGSGLFLHHGDWKGRTSPKVPEWFWDRFEESGIGDYAPCSDLPAAPSGPLTK